MKGDIKWDIPGDISGVIPGDIKEDMKWDIPSDISEIIPGDISGDIPGKFYYLHPLSSRHFSPNLYSQVLVQQGP